MPKSRSQQANGARSPTDQQPTVTPGSRGNADDFPIVGIGASAGGLEACKKLLRTLPTDTGMAFILVQHLDPAHESMMVDLLTGETTMVVCQATDGMAVECDHFYVIPPGTYLSVVKGNLHVSPPQARHGARLPFDFLLHSLAEDCGARGVGVVLSGTGADGSLGLRAIKQHGGLVIAQDPVEAGYDGMPRSAIMTGAVDLVLPVAKIPEALITYDRRMARTRIQAGLLPTGVEQDWLAPIIDLLRTRTPYDFTHYKSGTLQRRIERRMAMSAIETDDMRHYLEVLRTDSGELDLLSKDLLINVTQFFRDPQVFATLADKIIPDLVRNQPPDQPLRIWIAGCSTGEETYTLAMLFREEIVATKRNVKLQVFASDVDPDAIAGAREGLYPKSIEEDVSSERLARFFTKENQSYRISPDLRAAVVFTVQDLLADPPFSRLDLVSCRNLLIYLRPEAQAKVVSLFHFALREGGILLLGNSETISNFEGRFEMISKSERLYRHIGRSRPGEIGLAMGIGDIVRAARSSQITPPSRQAGLAELCRRLVIETYAPAAVLVNRKHECLFFLGPTDRFLHVAPGHPTHDLLAMTRPGLRTKLRSAIQRCSQEGSRVRLSGGQTDHDGRTISFGVDVQPVLFEGENLLLICFVEEVWQEQSRDQPWTARDAPRVTDLEQELVATRAELQGAIHNLEISNEEQKAINEEALSVQEEYQSTNEELLTSKEELQSLNEELTALNTQLQETLERQRTTSNDLQNILYSTDVATIFLDCRLNIRFFTPATKLLFNVLPGDIGRPLVDLSSLAPDAALLDDARSVLKNLVPIEQEIESRNGGWYLRRILPYRTQDNVVEGVVITFADITERRRVGELLRATKRQAEQANLAKSRFLAAASHDLRQPLQTLALVQGLLAKSVEGERAQKLVARLDETVAAMAGMLNALLDINQIEAGTVSAEVSSFPVNDLFARLLDEYSYVAQAQGLKLRVVPSSLLIRSDPRLLEQIIRNLLSNAIKYTNRGKVLLGCRRHGGIVSIEVRDTGVGIPEEELQAIFEEYHQLDNAARERSRGLGLGLSIVQRLSDLLGHRVHVRSQPGKGSVFVVDVESVAAEPRIGDVPLPHSAAGVVAPNMHRSGTILIVEDDPELRELLELLLKGEGHRTTTAIDGVTALGMVTRGIVRPDLILADFNLPNGMNGLQLAAKLREKLHRETPVVILTGDISTDTLRNIALDHCVQLNKPVKVTELAAAIERLLPLAPSDVQVDLAAPGKATGSPLQPVIFVVDDDRQVREGIREVLEDAGRTVEDFPTCEAFLDAYRPGREGCLLIDAYLPGMSGLDLLQRLFDSGCRLPAIMITGDSDVPMVVQAMKAGAMDFIEKPVSATELLAGVKRALELSSDTAKLTAWRVSAANHVADLTGRQRQIMDMILSGQPNKNIAADLGISQRTVENHRASIMKRTGVKSLPALARLAVAAAANGDGETLA